MPIFRDFFLLFKPKSNEARVREIMATQSVTSRQAERIVSKFRTLIPEEVSDENIYMKLFRNLPRGDIQMAFPHTQVRFRFFDKIKLAITAGGGLTLGVVGTAGKLASITSNPISAAGAVFALGGVAFRQFVSLANLRQRYVLMMAQNLYFKSVADTRGVMDLLAEDAAEDDFKEEILLYSVLAKEIASRADLPEIDHAVGAYMQANFGVSVNFDTEAALERLLRDGVVKEGRDGSLETLPPHEAAELIDERWSNLLDDLPDPMSGEGVEYQGASVQRSQGYREIGQHSEIGQGGPKVSVERD